MRSEHRKNYPYSTGLYILLFLFQFSLSYAQDEPVCVTSIWNAEKDVYDFSAIDEVAKKHQIIGLGESSHGLSELYKLKADLVTYLHQEHHYDLLIMEGGLGDINLVWLDHENLSAEQLRDESLFQNFQCREIMPLFIYMKEASSKDRPLSYAGIDTQLSGEVLEDQLTKLSEKNPFIIKEFEKSLDAYRQSYPASFQQDSTAFVSLRDSCKSSVNKIVSHLRKHKKETIESLDGDEFAYEIIIRSVANVSRSIDFSFADKTDQDGVYRGIVRRDEIMFENIQWLLENKYKGKKAIIWAHNAHLSNSTNVGRTTKWMGQLLAESYKEKYYSIGMFVHHGSAYQHWTGESVDFESSEENNVEEKMKAMCKAMCFFDIETCLVSGKADWMKEECKGFEIENMGDVYFIPKQRFNGMIYVDESGIPDYQEH